MKTDFEISKKPAKHVIFVQHFASFLSICALQTNAIGQLDIEHDRPTYYTQMHVQILGENVI